MLRHTDLLFFLGPVVESSGTMIMHWKRKAMMLNALSLLPSSASYAGYYWMQRHFGSLRQVNPASRLRAGVETWRLIREQGCDPSGKVFLEVGTGWVPVVPVAYWLMGAEKTITIDLHRYVRGELAEESLRYIAENCAEIKDICGNLLENQRFDALLAFLGNTKFSMDAFLDLCRIEYYAPGNASNTVIDSHSVDFHTSCVVLQHIPCDEVRTILQEGNRIVKSDGLFVHGIDYSDQFALSDSNISAINFLQFDEAEWGRYAGNRYAYVNRLRHDDFIELFRSVGHDILAAKPTRDQRSQDLLNNGSLHLNDRFNEKSSEILSIRAAWIVSKKGGEQGTMSEGIPRGSMESLSPRGIIEQVD